jgi:hypothetical protein
VIVGAAAQRLVVFAFCFFDRKIIDIRQPQTHETIVIEFTFADDMKVEFLKDIALAIVQEHRLETVMKMVVPAASFFGTQAIFAGRG